jgi:hypothetical protein
MNTKNYFKVAGIILAYPLSYAYIKYVLIDFAGGNEWLKRTVFVIFFALLNELIIRGRGRKPHVVTYFWYTVMLAVAATSQFGISEPVSMFGLHLCALYVAVLSNGILLENKTGSFIASDLFNAAFVKPFPGFGKIFMDIFSFRKKKDPNAIEAGQEPVKKSKSSVLLGLLVILIMIPIFIVAVTLLGQINKEFGNAVSKVLSMIDFRLDLQWLVENQFYFFLAVPVCLYLYGLLSKCADSDGERERARCERLTRFRMVCRKVSPMLSIIITGCFVLLYLSFFVFEGKYLFSAFGGMLPEEFTAAEYARRGFFELTGIMFINMLIFLAISYFENREGKGRKVSSGMIIALMTESVVFSAISFSKLALYYSRFGYTPKRLLAIWGTLIFAAGAILVIVSTIRKKDYSRGWIYFSIISFVAMNILSSVINLAMGGI